MGYGLILETSKVDSHLTFHKYESKVVKVGHLKISQRIGPCGSALHGCHHTFSWPKGLMLRDVFKCYHDNVRLVIESLDLLCTFYTLHGIPYINTSLYHFYNACVCFLGFLNLTDPRLIMLIPMIRDRCFELRGGLLMFFCNSYCKIDFF